MEAWITTAGTYGSWKFILLTDLAEFPEFLRFNEVKLVYTPIHGVRLAGLIHPVMSIAERCFQFQNHLQALKPALIASNSILFNCRITESRYYHFNGDSQLVNHLRDGLLPICDNSRSYKFIIQDEFVSDKEAPEDVLAPLLQIPQIISCPNVEIRFSRPTHLPVEVISRWLTGSSKNVAKICGKKMQNRLLKIYSDNNISNSQEMWDHLEQVS